MNKQKTDPMYQIAMDSLDMMDKAFNQAQKNTNDFNLGMAKVNQDTLKTEQTQYQNKFKSEVTNTNYLMDIWKDLNLSNAQIAQALEASTKGTPMTPDGLNYNKQVSSSYTQADLNNQDLNLNMKNNVFDPSLSDEDAMIGIRNIFNNPAINKGSTHYKNNIAPRLEDKEESLVFNTFKGLSIETLEGLVGSNPVAGFNLDFHVKALSQSTDIDRSEEVMDKAVTEYYDLFEDAQEAATAQLNYLMSPAGLKAVDEAEKMKNKAVSEKAKNIATAAVAFYSNIMEENPSFKALVPAFEITTGNDKNKANDGTTMFDFGGILKDSDKIGFSHLTFNSSGTLIPNARRNISKTDVRRLMQYFEGPGKAKWAEFQEVLKDNGMVE